MKAIVAAIALAGALTAGNAFAQDGDPAKGEAVFKRCQACHKVGPDAKNGVGPVLNGVVGRPAGEYEGYRYSDINEAAGAAGLVWTPENIVAYLPDPQGYLESYLKEQGKEASGRTKMAYKLTAEQDRKDVVAYLAQFGPDGKKQ